MRNRTILSEIAMKLKLHLIFEEKMCKYNISKSGTKAIGHSKAIMRNVRMKKGVERERECVCERGRVSERARKRERESERGRMRVCMCVC